MISISDVFLVALLGAAPFACAVESAPSTVNEVIDGSHIRVQGVGTVHLLYLAVPDDATVAGYAKQELSRFLVKDSTIRLWGPDASLRQDADGAFLAVVELNKAGELTVQAHMLNLGLAAYTGSAKEVPVWWRRAFALDQERAKEAQKGAWQSLSDWMASHATKEPIPDPVGVQAPLVISSPSDHSDGARAKPPAPASP